MPCVTYEYDVCLIVFCKTYSILFTTIDFEEDS